MSDSVLSSPPIAFLNRVSKLVRSEQWLLVDKFRFERGTKVPDWPEYVYLPYAGWYAVACQLLGTDVLKKLEDLHTMQEVSVAGTWRITQDIVRFDPDTFEALAHSTIDGDIPCDVLHRLPAWCIYIETQPCEGVPDFDLLHGFWVLLEYDVKTHEEEIRFYGCMKDGSLYPIILHIGDWDLKTAVMKSVGTSLMYATSEQRKQLVRRMKEKDPATDPTIHAMLSLTLYLCVHGLDGKRPAEDTRPVISYPSPLKVKQGWRLFPAARPKVWTAGADIGERLREGQRHEQADGAQRKGPRPHIRRAHWHTYWTGRRVWHEGETPVPQQAVTRWIPPLPVAMKDQAEQEEQEEKSPAPNGTGQPPLA